MLEIITTPNPLLLKKTDGVKKIDKKLSEMIIQMKQTLDATSDPIGVGLAAPQVGILLRIFLVEARKDGKCLVFINPKIESFVDEVTVKKRKRRVLEGCLSIPTIWGRVKRKKEVTVTYQNEKGKHLKKTFKGFLATVIQHEIDHLEGILFTKHVLEQGEKLYKSFKNDKGEDEFEEIKV